MKTVLVLSALVLAPFLCAAQDAQLRSRAVSLLESATAASVAPNLPNLERVDTFRVFDAAAKAREGSFTRTVLQGVGRREETIFGDFHVVSVWSGETLATTDMHPVIPREVAILMQLTPINLVHFDASDVIGEITDKNVGGRAAHCIEFETIVGARRDGNELCVDAANSTLLSEKLSDESIENSNFFSFAGVLLPGKITYSVSGDEKMEITQTMTMLTDGTNVLAAPPSAILGRRCTTFRRAIGQSMPQPLAGRGGRDWDVVLRGLIGVDGKVHDALVQSSDRPDLNAEALALIAQWTFVPAMCNGRPNPSDASFVLHFNAR
jgi:Gram-negative bacterial TonB protein C-terminal